MLNKSKFLSSIELMATTHINWRSNWIISIVRMPTILHITMTIILSHYAAVAATRSLLVIARSMSTIFMYIRSRRLGYSLIVIIVSITIFDIVIHTLSNIWIIRVRRAHWRMLALKLMSLFDMRKFWSKRPLWKSNRWILACIILTMRILDIILKHLAIILLTILGHKNFDRIFKIFEF